MIIKPEEMEIQLREQMRGGKGTVKLTHILKDDNMPGKCRIFALITMESGCSIGFHNHTGETEIYYFLKGQGQVDDNGKSLPVKPGDAMHTGGGKGHAVENTRKEPLEFLAVIILDE